MLYGIALPPYAKVKHHEGKGNFAVKKYYQFPFNFFYVWKLRMIVDMLGLGLLYRNILDFGAGTAEIFKTELQRHAFSVKCTDMKSYIDLRWRFDVVVCSSVLEFVPVEKVLWGLRDVMTPSGVLVVASPMDTWLSRFYFKLIGDKNKRHSHGLICNFLRRDFKEVAYKEWLGLYFVMKVKKK